QRQHLDRLFGAAGVGDADRHALLVEDGGAGETVVDLGPGVDVDADAIKPGFGFECGEGTAADAIDVDVPSSHDVVGDADRGRHVEEAGGRLQRQHVGV